ncbi:MAG: phage major capsid protein [Mogibacterium sp.]|nr:phage major capsid protein [Mogibacterium sp.]
MNEKTIDELMERRNQIAEEMNAEGADLDALESEVRSINEELENRKKAEAQRAEIRKAVAEGEGEKKNEFKEEKHEMSIEEIRSSHEYNVAYAEYIKSEDESEVRAILTTELVSGQVPVPTYVEDRVRTNWDKLGIMRRVRKTFVKGILKVGFEKSATGAVAHTEGTNAPDDETLTFGVVSLTPVSIKKWIKISDEAMDLKGEAFLDYIYDEITYQIAKKAQNDLIAAIAALTASATTTAPGVGIVTGTPSLGVIAEAIGKLGDEASDPIVVMNKGSWAKFKAAQYAGQFNVDPFEGLAVEFDNTLPVYASTITGSTWAIVGDFGFGAQANFPNGQEIGLKFDDLSLAEADLVKIVGREYVGLGIVADKAFTKIVG